MAIMLYPIKRSGGLPPLLRNDVMGLCGMIEAGMTTSNVEYIKIKTTVTNSRRTVVDRENLFLLVSYQEAERALQT